MITFSAHRPIVIDSECKLKTRIIAALIEIVF